MLTTFSNLITNYVDEFLQATVTWGRLPIRSVACHCCFFIQTTYIVPPRRFRIIAYKKGLYILGSNKQGGLLDIREAASLGDPLHLNELRFIGGVTWEEDGADLLWDMEGTSWDLCL